MKFEFGGEAFEGTKIGYVASKNEFLKFLKLNSSEIEEIISDSLEQQDIYQWDQIDIDCRVSDSDSDSAKHIILVDNHFHQEECFNDNMLVRVINATIFCITEADLLKA